MSVQKINPDTYVGDTGKQLKNIADALYHYGQVSTINDKFNVGIYRYTDPTKSQSPFNKFEYGHVVVIPYRKAVDNTQVDYAVQIFFGDVDISIYGQIIYYRFGFKNDWGNWYPLHTRMPMDGTEVPTGEIINGKIVYAKCFKFTDTLGSSPVFSKNHNISNAERIWLDAGNSYFKSGYTTIPLPSNCYYGNFNDSLGVHIDDTKFYIYAQSGWNTNWEKVVTLKYLKK